MAENKTKATGASVGAFLDAIADEGVRRDSKTLVKIMKAATGKTPKMWGPAIVGFGTIHYEYDSGHAGDTCLTGFAPRGKQLSIYITSGLHRYESLLAKLGKHKAGKGCLYVKRLADVDMGVLTRIIERSVKDVQKT